MKENKMDKNMGMKENKMENKEMPKMTDQYGKPIRKISIPKRK